LDGTVDDLLNVVAAWWDGRQTTDMEVFGWKMLYYGRAGKIMLLVAGLAVIFDLLKPETVIRWAAFALFFVGSLVDLLAS
jgi:hypothetical protein